jgi:hypothetical protein
MPIGSKLYEAGKTEATPEGETTSDDEPKTDEPIEGEVVDEDKK